MAKGSESLERIHAFDSVRQALEAVEPACGAGFYECSSQKSEGFHYCCAAKRIAEPDTGALLTYSEFADTLRHYKQNNRQIEVWDLFEEYVSSACLSETWEELEQAEDKLEAIVVEIDQSEANGEKLSWDCYEQMNTASKEIDAIRKKSREKAKRLAGGGFSHKKGAPAGPRRKVPKHHVIPRGESICYYSNCLETLLCLVSMRMQPMPIGAKSRRVTRQHCRQIC